jgi:selenophosphate synthetase-related protein
MLVCAVLGSLAAGVLAACGLCLGMFRIFRIHAEQAAAERVARLQNAATGTASVVGG